jgi:DNA recombination protein RmuC
MTYIYMILIVSVLVLAVLLARARASMAGLRDRLELEQRHADEKLRLLEGSEERLKVEFENLANRIFEEKGKVISEQNQQKLTSTLLPFREQLEAFRTRVEEVHKTDTEQTLRLSEQVRQLQQMSNKVSEEANNLASAIKGDTKRQGDWGELMVERIFEASGLEKGREYEAQRSFDGDDGRMRPDFVVHLPGEKSVVVDSKVSLTAFERYHSAEDEAGRKAALDEHIKSVRNHLKGLREKSYADLLGNRTLDFVIMCVPLEPAYHAAMQGDPDLLYDLARTQVVMTGPGTLVVTLKLIAQIWRREKENRNAEVIAEKAGKMYDAIVRTYEAMTDAEKKMSGVSESFALAMSRLKDGRGSLLGRAEDLRKLGAKVRKELPAGVMDDLPEDDDPGEEPA